MNQKGQTILETLIVLPLLSSMVCLVVYVLVLSLSYFYCQYHLQEAVFCHLSFSSSSCKSILLKKLKYIPTADLNSVSFSSTEHFISGHLQFHFPNLICIKKETPDTCSKKLAPFTITKTIETNQWQ